MPDGTDTGLRHPTQFARPAHFWDLLDESARAVLASSGVRHGHPAGTTLLREGELANSVLVLLSGRVKILATGVSGYRGLLAIRTPGLDFSPV